MKKIKMKIILCFLLFGVFITNNTFASSNKISYTESGKVKFFTVRVNIHNSKSTSHTISGEYQSGPSGYGLVYYSHNGVTKAEEVHGTGQSSYWRATFELKTGNIIQARTYVTSKGLKDSYVTDYLN